MDVKQLFKKYRAKLNMEAFVKALLWGLLAGFAVNLLFMIAAMLFYPKIFWIGFIAWGAVTLIVTPIVFFKVRPTDKEVARRIDLIGLEERVITMNELKDQDTFIARIQRQDTIDALSKVNSMLLKFAVSLPLIIVLAVVAALSVGASTVTTLAATGTIVLNPEKPGPGGIVDIDPTEPDKYYTIEYVVDGEVGGNIEGDVMQVVKEKTDATGVLAVADDGFAFVMWSDGSEEPYRLEREVLEDMTIYAIFAEGDGGDGDGDGDPSENGNEGEADDDGDKPGDEEGEGHQPTNDPNNEAGNGAGGEYEPHNQVIDGETYYNEVLENDMDDIMERLEKNGQRSKEDSDYVANYLKAIKK